jgi:hypothetical protein
MNPQLDAARPFFQGGPALHQTVYDEEFYSCLKVKLLYHLLQIQFLLSPTGSHILRGKRDAFCQIGMDLLKALRMLFYTFFASEMLKF